jgi:SNF2 family DNA or RNA helicase
VALPAPTGFDAPDRLDAFLDAVRWGAASTAEVRNIQAPFRSGIDIEDYQLDPVVRAMHMPRVNLLIADDVGLGKTIEAGMTMLELILRHRARRILVVCPAALQVQWHDQMRDKFGLDFRIVDSALMKDLRRTRGIHANPWTHFPRLITSLDFLKRERPLRLFTETLPAEGESLYPRRYDMLVVDEAHNCAPSGRGKYATDSLRTAAIRVLAPHFEHKLFLTATPHNGYPESFSALLELLDNQRFARGTPPDRRQLNAIMALQEQTPTNLRLAPTDVLSTC